MVIPYLSSFLFTVVKKFSDTSFKYLVHNVHVGQNLPLTFCNLAKWGIRSTNVQISTNVDSSTNAQFSTSAPICQTPVVGSFFSLRL